MMLYCCNLQPLIVDIKLMVIDHLLGLGGISRAKNMKIPSS